MKKEYGFLSAGEWRQSDTKLPVKNPYDNETFSFAFRPTTEDIGRAIEAAKHSFQETKALPSHRRSSVCHRVAKKIAEDRDSIAKVLSLEAGKPIVQARVEVERAVATFTAAAEEAKRIDGEVIPLDWDKDSEKRLAIVRRFPIGPVLAITPFNFPLNLVAHKVAPAIACGCPIVVKPASKTPLCSIILAEIVLEAGYPSSAMSVLPVSGNDAETLVSDERFRLITFTGSSDVGWRMKEKSGKKKVILELGGNAGVIIHKDADLDYAMARSLAGGFYYAGQSCISVQRIFLHEEIYDSFLAGFLEGVSQLVVGDPLDEKTQVGPMISEEDAARVEEWVNEATSSGGKILTGGTRKGSVFRPTVLTDIRPDMKVSCQEVFAPLVVIEKYRDINDAIAWVDNSVYGLQAGIFTRDISSIFKAYDKIEVGGLIANDIPTFRIDHMPYGGVKNSGVGREGPKYAIEDMTETRLLVMNMNI